MMFDELVVAELIGKKCSFCPNLFDGDEKKPHKIVTGDILCHPCFVELKEKLDELVRKKSRRGPKKSKPPAENQYGPDQNQQQMQDTLQPEKALATQLTPTAESYESTTCKRSGEQELHFCSDCQIVCCASCVATSHAEHKVEKPPLKMLNIWRLFMQTLEKGAVAKENSKNVQLGQWREGWERRITYQYEIQLAAIDKLVKDIQSSIKKLSKKYKTVIEQARDNLLGEIRSVCPSPKDNELFEVARGDIIQLIGKLKRNNFKEDPIMEEYLNELKRRGIYHLKLTTPEKSVSAAKMIEERFKVAKISEFQCGWDKYCFSVNPDMLSLKVKSSKKSGGEERLELSYDSYLTNIREIFNAAIKLIKPEADAMKYYTNLSNLLNLKP